MVCVLVFIGVSVYACVSIYVVHLYFVLKKLHMATKCHVGPRHQHECATSRGKTKDRHKMVSSAVCKESEAR
jgi:hypothetical protein